MPPRCPPAGRAGRVSAVRRGCPVTAAASPQRRASLHTSEPVASPTAAPSPPTMNTIVFSKLSGQVLFEEDAKERERSGRPYVGVVDGPHHAEVLLPDSPSIKESLSLRNRRTGYAVRSSPRRAPDPPGRPALRTAAGAPGSRVSGLRLRYGFLDGSFPARPGPYPPGLSFHSYAG